jgi:hypothetical protein
MHHVSSEENKSYLTIRNIAELGKIIGEAFFCCVHRQGANIHFPKMCFKKIIKKKQRFRQGANILFFLKYRIYNLISRPKIHQANYRYCFALKSVRINCALYDKKPTSL